jgi:3-dehydroquinate dehydratase-2
MASKDKKQHIRVIHGPNLNMLGTREPDIYGRTTLADIDTLLKVEGERLGVEVSSFQSNSEGAIVDHIQSIMGNADGLIINPAAYTHNSVAIRDALLTLGLPIVEVHISNIHRREAFRHRSLIADIVTGQIIGLGVKGYFLALRALAERLSPNR